MEAIEYAFPFDSGEETEEGYDREYFADDFARYFRAFISSGIIADGGNIADSLQVVANGDMTTTLRKGNLIIDGYRYELTKDMTFQHRAADGVLDRIDRISITLDTAEREIHAILLEGDYSYKPIAPQCRRNSEYMDYVVADVRIVASAIKIMQTNITDTRLNTELCGIAWPFWTLDTKPFFAQLNSFYEEFVLRSDRSYDEFLAWEAEKKIEINAWQNDEHEEVDAWQKREADDFKEWADNFILLYEGWMSGKVSDWTEEIQNWFQNLREQLTDNAEVNLQTQIGNLNDLKTEQKSNLVDAINSLPMTYDGTMVILGGIKTVTVTLSTVDGVSVEGQTVTLHNEMTKEDTICEYKSTIQFEVFGDMEYSISVRAMENYVTPDTVRVCITDGEGANVDMTYQLKELNELPWTKIIEVAESGKARELFSLHDAKEVELSTGEKIVLEIADFDHDILSSDQGKTAGITFAMKDALMTKCQMNATNTNVGGWKESQMRVTTVREHLYEVLPEELKDGIKLVDKKTSAGNKSKTVETTADDVWLFSLVELGVTGLSSPYTQEGSAYPIFTSNAERVRHSGTGGSTTAYHTRSPYTSNATQFRCISTSGANTYGNASVSYGLVAGLCL